ncbi:MAG: dihydroneopterin aldolase [Taibaiella sp.]|nr:dihydroneopterin aldolase [Taibaiella sp.]
MLTVSLHKIAIHAPIGLYPEEKITGNDFETDVDVWLPDELPWPFMDYSLIYQVVSAVFSWPVETLEALVQGIYTELSNHVPGAEKIRVAVRKLHPPVAGVVGYSQVVYEK